MGTRQARRRRVERAHERYAAVLLAVGMPGRLLRREGITKINWDAYLWYDYQWREEIRQFYIAAHLGTPAPCDKTVKKFVRGYVAWLRREVDARRCRG